MLDEEKQIFRTTTLSRAFRTAIERCERALLPIAFANFPRGACGDTALLLGTFLAERGEGVFDYVLGTRGRGRGKHSHAWIERDSLIVDITADQFPEVADSVIVTTRSAWHGEFVQKRGTAASYKIYDLNTVNTLAAAYREIVSHLS